MNTEILHRQIYCELSPFFRYATLENRSLTLPTVEARTKRIYSQCVACNSDLTDLYAFRPQVERHHDKEVAYFCPSCEEEIDEINRKYSQPKDKEIFVKVLNDYFGAQPEAGPKEEFAFIQTLDIHIVNGEVYVQHTAPQSTYESPSTLRAKNEAIKGNLSNKYLLEGPLPMPSLLQKIQSLFGKNLTISTPFVIHPVKHVPLIRMDNHGNITIPAESELTEHEKSLINKNKDIPPPTTDSLPPGTYVLLESTLYRAQEKLSEPNRNV